MAQIASGISGVKSVSPPEHNPVSVAVPPRRPGPETMTPLQSFKTGHFNLDTFSPVNQNGSFEFDRVLKSGKVNRRVKNRGAWKPTWKPTYLVLRPNLLSLYKYHDETGIRASITLSDVTAVALVKKANTANVFGVFSPSKNYYLEGASAEDTADWIERIRTEARVDIRDEIILASPLFRNEGAEDRQPYKTTDLSGDEDGDRPSSPEMAHRTSQARKEQRSQVSASQRQPSGTHDYSGNEMMTSHSDFSDTPATSDPRTRTTASNQTNQTTTSSDHRPSMARNASKWSVLDATTDAERVIRHGWLHCLKTKGGVKQWKKLWVVLRPKNISFYKNEQEYSAVKIVSMSSIINAAEIDPMSKSKKYCLQVIMEDKTYRFCAPTEDSLAQWLGSLKSVLAKRKDKSRQVAEATAALLI